MKYFTNIFTPFRELPLKTSKKIADIPENTVVITDEFMENDFYHVEYNGRNGWISRNFIDPYLETLPKNCINIPNQTPNENDFEQYFFLDGVKQVNFCGQIALCYAAKMDLEDFISIMQLQAPILWKRLKGSGKFKGTTAADLMQMCSVLALPAQPMDVVTKDTILSRSRYTVAGLKNLCDTGFPVVACKIDAGSGRLRGQGVGHWALITAIFPERAGARVQLFNPAPNRIEEYSWQELTASMGQPYGVWIERTVE
jgi:hypothetical protein